MIAQAEEGKARTRPAFSQVDNDWLFTAMLGLSGVRGLCLAAIVRDQSGSHKQASGTVPVEAIAKAHGVSAASVQRAIRRLVREGLIERTGPGRYRFRDDYAARFGEDMVAFIEAQKSRHATDRTVRTRGQNCPEERTELSGKADRSVRAVGQMCPEKRTEVSAPLNKKREINTEETLSQSARATPADSRFFPDPIPEAAPPPSTLHPKATPERRKAVVALADQAGGWGYEAGKELQLGADPDHLEEAIRRATRSRARSWQYVARIADGFRVHGIDQPPPPVPDRPQRHRPGSPEALAEWKARRDAAWGITPEREAVA